VSAPGGKASVLEGGGAGKLRGWEGIRERRAGIEQRERGLGLGCGSVVTRSRIGVLAKSEDPRSEDRADMGRSNAAPLRRNPRAQPRMAVPQGEWSATTWIGRCEVSVFRAGDRENAGGWRHNCTG